MGKKLLPIVVLTAGLASGQTASQPVAFEAASLKVASKGFIPGVSFRMSGGPGTGDPGRITYTQIPLMQLLMKALKFDARGADSAVVVAPGVRAASPSGSPSDPSGLPSLFNALEKQLGLKLIKSKGFPLDTIVIDQIQRIPAGN